MTVISFLAFVNGHAAVIFGATIKNVNNVAEIFLVFNDVDSADLCKFIDEKKQPK